MGRRSFAPWFLILLALVVGSRPTTAEPDADGAERYELENGLKVRLRPVAGASDVAVLVLYDVGERHDPEGQSGLAHLVEHCYVTSAAGDVPARTAEAMMAAYPNAWNAQTGHDYTVIAFIAPRERLAAELAEAAARMGDLRVTEADLEREKPRMVAELGNMYVGIPTLAAANHVRGMVAPAATGARKGGVEAQIKAITLDDVRDHHGRHYKPRYARLIVAGGFDSNAVREDIAKLFGGLPRGEVLPTPRSPGPASPDGHHDMTIGEGASHEPQLALLARRAPEPTDAHYAPFLLLASRLFRAQMTQTAGGRQLIFPVIDAPRVLLVQAPVAPGEDSLQALASTQTYINETAKAPLTPVDRFHARQFFGYTLATFPLPDAALATNVYGLAFGIGRREQMGIDGKALGERLSAVTDAEMQHAAEALLPRTNGANLVLHTPRPARRAR